MVQIIVSIKDDDQPDAVAQISMDATQLNKCESKADIRRVIGNLGLQLLAAIGGPTDADGKINIEREYDTKL